MMTQYLVLAYYHFAKLENPLHEIALHKKFCKERDIKCRVYINEEGINGQMSASKDDGEAYMEWLKLRTPFESVVFKLHSHREQVFPRQTIKYRKELVAFDPNRKVDLSLGGEHLSPEEWRKMLESNEQKLLIDVRNDYEWKVGRFEGAELPPCDTFREFNDYAEKLTQDPEAQKTPVMMYCTGGIRCEIYSTILREKGFEKVYQLNGGIINYGLQEGSSHWLGKLFVFDDRLTVPIAGEETPVIGKCHHCDQPNENYFNCANMECNELFLCCPDCLQKFQGCCCEECQKAERVRPFEPKEAYKPFRRRHHYSL